jgi:soluble lytic murein transglycosylase-like protein
MVRIGSLFALCCAAALGLGAAAVTQQERHVTVPVKREGALPSGSRLPTGSAAVTTACPIPARYRAVFTKAADDARLPLSLLAAVAWIESRFVADARSHKGAFGLLQVMPGTGRALGLDISRPATNVLAGARFLRLMLDRFGSSDVALAAYNAGPGAVERAHGAPSLETLRYVIDVNARWRAHVGCAA